MTPFVVDANVMNYFQAERLHRAHGPASCAIYHITGVSAIALDADGHCEAEWLECAAGAEPLALKDWIADMLALERILLCTMKCESMFKELANLGVPKKDHKWVRLARSSDSAYIVTEDIDLFDPKKKKSCTAKQKIKIKESCSGPVAKHLKKNYKISVISCCNVPGACVPAAC